MRRLELLAPARNIDIGIAAIDCGADAVYIGGPSFGARSAALNSVQDILRLVQYAHRFGARIFVTVNTLFENEDEREQAVSLIRELDGAGVDAIIVQDPSIVGLLAQKTDWKTAFHASTQCAIRTPERALELWKMGFSRLVLERQLSLRQVRQIRDSLPPEAELEYFVHGALCVCYSGDCYLSELLTGRSANRGECAQPCRSRYDLLEEGSGKLLLRDEPLLSLKDLCLAGRLEEVADAGVCSLKIEGRLKSSSYVKNVVRAYSQALDDLVRRRPEDFCRASFGRVEGGFAPDLGKTFNRGYTELFVDGHRGAWHSEEASTFLGERVGKVAALKKGGLLIEDLAPGMRLSNGDGLCFATAKGVEGFRADVVEKMPGGVLVHCRPETMPSPGTEIRRNRDAAFEKQLETQMPTRLVAVRLDARLTESAVLLDALREDGAIFTLEEPLPELCPSAQNPQRMEQMIRGQLGKTAGWYRFSVRDIICEGGRMPLLGAAFLNEIRRRAAQEAEKLPVCATAMNHLQPSLPEDANPVHPRKEGELMRSKYCIRHRLGMCSKALAGRNDKKDAAAKMLATDKASAGGNDGRGLALRNNGRLLPLGFDCEKCEMTVLRPRQNSKK